MSTKMQTTLNPLLVLYSELSKSRIDARETRQARLQEGCAAAQAKASDPNALLELGRECVGAVAEVAVTDEDAKQAIRAALTCLNTVHIPERGEAEMHEGAARALSDVDRHLRSEREVLLECVRKTEEARTEAQRA